MFEAAVQLRRDLLMFEAAVQLRRHLLIFEATVLLRQHLLITEATIQLRRHLLVTEASFICHMSIWPIQVHLSFPAYSCSIFVRASTKFPYLGKNNGYESDNVHFLNYLSRKSIPLCV